MSNPFAETLAQAGADIAPAPGGECARNSASRAKARRDLQAEQSHVSTVNVGHEMAFAWLRNDTSTPFGLVSCYVNGKPSALIVAAKPHHDESKVEVMPLFVALCDGMRVTTPNGEVIFENGGVA